MKIYNPSHMPLMSLNILPRPGLTLHSDMRHFYGWFDTKPSQLLNFGATDDGCEHITGYLLQIDKPMVFFFLKSSNTLPFACRPKDNVELYNRNMAGKQFQCISWINHMNIGWNSVENNSIGLYMINQQPFMLYQADDMWIPKPMLTQYFDAYHMRL